MRSPFLNLKYYLAGLALFWTLAMVGGTVLHLNEEDSQVVANARIEADALMRREVLALQWSARQGGVYVPVSAEIQPDLRLARLPERDVTTPSGKILTLLNPVCKTLPDDELDARRYGGGHLVSTRSPDSGQAPDAWDVQALEKLRAGEAEVSSLERQQTEEFLRVMRPLQFAGHCQECHPRQDSAGKPVQAGISLLVPLTPLRLAVAAHQQALVSRYLLLWLEGIGALLLGFWILRRQRKLAEQSEERRSQAERSINYLTYHDPLTGLPNRQLFDDRLRLALVHAGRLDQQVAVVQFGLDKFKHVNGSLGHAAGDSLLQEVARRLSLCLRPDDSIARFGADRFLLLFPGLRKAEDAAKVIEKVLLSFDQPLLVEEREVFLSASSGIALFPADGRDSNTLLRNAESALNRAKDLGRGTFQFYAPAMNFRAVEQIALDAGLRRALELGQLEVHYQPQVDGVTGEILGAEALLRWNHPEFGLVSPDQFIPMAEESGQILAIGRWVLETACRQTACWRTDFGKPLHIGVNLSPRQFQQPDLVEMIESILDATGLPAEALEIEITEGILIRDFDQALENLTDLKVRGVKIAIDDFGTGYSSLSYLVKFPIDRLKIDRSFVAGLESDAGNQVVVNSIIDLAARMHIELIAEGVETESQREILLQNRCRYMQGFLFGRAVNVGTFIGLLSA